MKAPLWKRNVIGAVVSVAAFAVAAAFVLWPAWQRYQQTVRPAHVAAAGDAIEVDGLTWSIRNVSRSTMRRGAPLPEGTVVVNVLLERSGTPEQGFGCYGYLIDGDRSWRADGPPCGAAVSIPWTFLVPTATEPTAVDIRKSDGSVLIRFRL